MKLEATIVLSLKAPSLAAAGETLDEVLRGASERDEVDVQSVVLQTPAASVPVTLPQPPVVPVPAPSRPPVTSAAATP